MLVVISVVIRKPGRINITNADGHTIIIIILILIVIIGLMIDVCCRKNRLWNINLHLQVQCFGSGSSQMVLKCWVRVSGLIWHTYIPLMQESVDIGLRLWLSCGFESRG